jgi:archaellin
MLKIFIAFVIFAAIALTVVFKMGDNIDMQGEAAGHDITQSHDSDKTKSEAPAAEGASTAPAEPAAPEKK